MANSVSKIAQNQRKSFKNYQKLPAELRMMIVDEMKPDDRCRFSQCSILSSMEAKKSKNYMYSLKFVGLFENILQITVTYDSEMKMGFHLDFLENCNKKYMNYSNFENKELRSTELPGSTDLVQFASGYFKNYLQDYQNIIKELSVENYIENKWNFDFGEQSLKNLEVLDVNFNSSILPIISKLQKPLKKLMVYEEENNRELENYEISNISELLCLPHFKLNYEKFMQLTARSIFIHIGELTEEDIHKMIKLWQNQATDGRKIYYEWSLEDSKFDVSKLLRLLGADVPYRERGVLMEIKHEFEGGMKAQLILHSGNLSLEVDLN